MEGRIRVGTTSYIKPADILPNVRYLAPLVDDIELVLFESAEASNLPDERTIAELASLASEHDLTYTVHFPLDIFPGSRDEAERAEAAMMLNGIVSLTEELDPFGYVLHLTPDHYGVSPSHEVEAWLYKCSTDYLLGIEKGTPTQTIDVSALTPDQIQALQSLIDTM